MTNLKLFIWKDVLSEYTEGIAFALAINKDEAIELIIDKYKKDGYFCDEDFRKELEDKSPLVISEPSGFYLFGCGG